MSEGKIGCSLSNSPEENVTTTNKKEKDGVTMVMVGSKAPDFKLSGYYRDDFKEFSLSDYRGKWVLLCFYPGDFTFV